MVLNIGQFMMQEEVLEKVDNSLWFEAYSHALQRVREATRSQRWQWPKGKAWKVGVSPLVRAFWEETGVKLAASCTRLCWELPLRGVFRRRERGPISHVITFLDNMAVHVPTLNAWDQFVWPSNAAMPRAITEVEQYGYRHGNAIDLGPVMLVMQFRVTDEEGTYLCAMWALVFEGSILAYNPARDEAEWVPTCSVGNDLSWAEERSAVALVNYVPMRTALQSSGPAALWVGPTIPPQREKTMSRQRKKMVSRRVMSQRGMNMRMQRGREKRTPNCCPVAQCSSKAKQNKRSNHGDDDDRGSGGL